MNHALGRVALQIAQFDMLRTHGLAYEESVHLTAIDLDARCVQMAFIQLSLRNVPALLVHGNALSLEEYECWYTPAHVQYRWFQRLEKARTSKGARPHFRAMGFAGITPIAQKAS